MSKVRNAFAVAFLFLLIITTTASAVSLCPLSDPDRLAINGNANLLGGNPVARLTKAEESMAGSVFSKLPRRIDDGFSVEFDVTISNLGGSFPDPEDDLRGADGFTFVIAADPSALGAAGGGLGYSGIPDRSLAVEFDTWFNAGVDIDGNHAGIDLDGSLASLASARVPFLMTGSDFHVWIDYDSGQIEVRVKAGHQSARPDTPLLSLAIDLEEHFGAQPVYFGFTGATGAEWATHDILRWIIRPRSKLAVEKAALAFKKSVWNLAVKRGVFALGIPVHQEVVDPDRIRVIVVGTDEKEFFRAGSGVTASIKTLRKTGEVLRITLRDEARNLLVLDLKKGRMKLIANQVPNPMQLFNSNSIRLTIVFGDMIAQFNLGGPETGRSKVPLQPATGAEFIECGGI